MKAILLAAGMGTRLRPITIKTPKPLIKIKGETIIERQIKFLREIGIDEIIVVTGYLKDKFEFLKEKYGVKIIQNDMYDKYNNIYTMYLVKDYLKDTYVIEGDIYLNKNFLKGNIEKSSYFSAPKYGFNDEWMLEVGNDNRVIGIEEGSEDGRYIMCGVSYWNNEDGDYIVKKLEERVVDGDFTKLFWDHVVKDNIKKLDIRLEKLEADDVYEIDSLMDLKYIEEKLECGI